MLKKYLFIGILFLVSGYVFAEQCPTVTAIKKNQLLGWKIYDSEDGKLLSNKRAADIKNRIVSFTMAEWTNQSKKTGTIHCYYRDKDGSNLESYLAKEHFSVSQNGRYWYEVSDRLQCAAGAKNCEFSPAPILKTQLAKN